MKLLSIILVCCLLLTTKCYDAPNEVTITGKIYTGFATTLTYTIPYNGVFHWGFEESVKADAKGNFQIKIPCKQTSIVAIGVNNHSKKTMIISPGDRFTLELGRDRNKVFFELKGPNKAGQELFSALPNPGFVQVAARKYTNDTLVSDIQSKIDAEKAKDLEPFKALLEAKKISPAFYELVSDDRDCYYAALQTQVVFGKVIRTERAKIGGFSPDFEKWAQEIYQKHSLENPRLIRSSWWYEYAQTFQNISMHLLDKDFDFEDFAMQHRNGTMHTFNLKDAESRFKGAYLEFFKTSYLYSVCSQEEYEKELIALFDQFKKRYPQSSYSKYVQVRIDPIVKYHQVQGTPFSDQYKLMDNTSFNSLESSVAAFKGKKLFIDIWATWCAPCKQEFAYKDALKKLLNEQGYEILYISLDDRDRIESWKGMIKYYKLEGHHLRANEALSTDLQRIYNQNGGVAIPWYMIVNEEGQLVFKNAARPSDTKTLEAQLKSL